MDVLRAPTPSTATTASDLHIQRTATHVKMRAIQQAAVDVPVLLILHIATTARTVLTLLSARTKHVEDCCMSFCDRAATVIDRRSSRSA